MILSILLGGPYKKRLIKIIDRAGVSNRGKEISNRGKKYYKSGQGLQIVFEQSEICDSDDLRQLSRLEIRFHVFRCSAIPQKRFITVIIITIIIIIISSNSNMTVIIIITNKLILVITCLGRRFEINCPRAFLEILGLPVDATYIVFP